MFWKRIIVRLRRPFGLRDGTDVDGTVSLIRQGVALRGANLWLLFASAALASIGLDTNSTAVIIGAMLISPLMSPILGVGLAVGIVDRRLLWEALRNLFIAFVLSLATSSAYFFVSPLGVLTDELASRTVPTLLDVGVALFGGLAGIVAMSRLEKTTAIPGVAIATALMPPVCTAGFGIAKAEPAVLFGALYLFFLNAVFIALSTFLVVRALGFPSHEEVDAMTRRRVRFAIVAFVGLVTIPSILLLVSVVGRQKLDQSIQTFVRAEIDGPSRTALRWSVRQRLDGSELVVYLGGEAPDEEALSAMQAAMDRYGLGDYRLRVVESVPSQGARRAMVGEVQSEFAQRIEAVEESAAKSRRAAEEEAARLREELRRSGADPAELEALRGEIAAAFPEIATANYAPRLEPVAGAPEAAAGATEAVPARAVLVTFARGTSNRARASARARLASWLEERLDVRPVVVVDAPPPGR